MAGNLNFLSSHCRQKLSQRSTSKVLWKEAQFFSLCQFWPEDPVANNDTLAPNSDAKYLILCKTALSQPLEDTGLGGKRGKLLWATSM
jgi:hypothetical protein